MVADDPTLYPDAAKELNLLYANKARFLFPGWWFAPGEGRDFLARRLRSLDVDAFAPMGAGGILPERQGGGEIGSGP